MSDTWGFPTVFSTKLENFLPFPLNLKHTHTPPPPGQLRAAATKAFQYLQGMPKEAYFSAFTGWISRLRKCFSVKGEYFERLKCKVYNCAS